MPNTLRSAPDVFQMQTFARVSDFFAGTLDLPFFRLTILFGQCLVVSVTSSTVQRLSPLGWDIDFLDGKRAFLLPAY